MFQQAAYKAIDDITSRQKLPIMVGGTGLYIDSVIYEYGFGTKNITDRQQLRQNTLVVGLQIEREQLKERVGRRVDQMIAAGLEAEVKTLSRDYGWDSEALKGIGYAQWQDYFLGTKNLAETRQLIIKSTLDLAKRQRTWFKRNKSIQWFMTPVKEAEVADVVTTFFDK